MSRTLTAGLSALALTAILPTLTSAQIGPPHRKPGMWETTMTLPNGQPMTMAMCTDEATETKFSAMRPPQGAAAAARDCSQPDVKMIPGGYSAKTVCTVRGKTTQTLVVALGDFQSRYTMDMTTTSDGAPERKMSMAVRWTGPCPAGRKGGDMVMPGGMVVNMNAMGAGR